MRRVLWLLGLAVLLALVGIPLAGAIRDGFQGWRSERAARAQQAECERIQAANEVPPPDLPARPGDRDRFPRSSFVVRYVGHYGFAVDTGRSTVTKDMIIAADTTVSMRLPDAQLDSLYERCLADRLFDTSMNQQPHEGWAGAGDHGGELVVRAGGLENRLSWLPASFSDHWTDEWKRLHRIVGMVQRMAMQHPAYRALPPPTGLYFD